MEKLKQHTFEFVIPEENHEPIINGEQCPVFLDRTQGSIKCINCTYSRTAMNTTKQKLVCECVRSYYTDRHHKATIDVVDACRHAEVVMHRRMLQEEAEKREAIRDELLKNGIVL